MIYIPSGQWDLCESAENSIAMLACVLRFKSGDFALVERAIMSVMVGVIFKLLLSERWPEPDLLRPLLYVGSDRDRKFRNEQ